MDSIPAAAAAESRSAFGLSSMVLRTCERGPLKEGPNFTPSVEERENSREECVEKRPCSFFEEDEIFLKNPFIVIAEPILVFQSIVRDECKEEHGRMRERILRNRKGSLGIGLLASPWL